MREWLKTNMPDVPVTLIGRVTREKDYIPLEWENAGFSCRFCGDAAYVYFDLDERIENPLYLLVTVDGKHFKYSMTCREQTLVCDGLGDGEHTFSMVRLTEMKQLQAGHSDSLRVTAIWLTGEAPAWREAPAERPRTIDFYGDSITNGYGALNDGTWDGYRMAEQDVTKTYAWLTAEHFNANAVICAHSGRGVVATCSGDLSEPILKWYDDLTRVSGRKVDPAVRHPDLIVVTLGTNDASGNLPIPDFMRGVDAFVDRLRGDYPATDLIWVFGAMGSLYMEALTERFAERRLTDPHVHFLPMEPIKREKQEVGASWHPSQDGQRRMAGELIAAIEAWHLL